MTIRILYYEVTISEKQRERRERERGRELGKEEK
jgi:hypothetical protein